MPRNGNSLPCAAHHFEMRKDQKAKSMNFSEIDDPPRTMARSLQLLLLFAVTMQGVLRNQVQEMRIDRRAWVGVSIKGFPKPNEPFRITIVLANSGKTFAKHVNLAGHARRYSKDKHLILGRKQKKLQINEILKRSMILSWHLTLLRKIQPGSNDTATLSETEVEALKNDLSHANVNFLSFGQVTYEDIFGHNHWLIFCYALVYDQRQSENGGWVGAPARNGMIPAMASHQYIIDLLRNRNARRKAFEHFRRGARLARVRTAGVIASSKLIH